jgi:hypothetical protein
MRTTSLSPSIREPRRAGDLQASGSATDGGRDLGGDNPNRPCLQQFGLARVTASEVGSDGDGPLPTYRSRLAWIGVYEISKNADTSCPAEPTHLPKNLSPVFAHYYFAVLVDATTGQEATWNEDMSGLLFRECHRALS